MRDTFLMNIVKTAKQLSEIVTTSSLAECATEGNIVEEFSTLCKLKSDADNWVLSSVIFLNKSVLAVLVHVYDIRVRKFSHSFNFSHK